MRTLLVTFVVAFVVVGLGQALPTVKPALGAEDVKKVEVAAHAEDTAAKINAVTEYMKVNNIDPQQVRAMLADTALVAKLKTWVEAMKTGTIPTDPEFVALIAKFKLNTAELQTRAKARDILAELMAWNQQATAARAEDIAKKAEDVKTTLAARAEDIKPIAKRAENILMPTYTVKDTARAEDIAKKAEDVKTTLAAHAEDIIAKKAEDVKPTIVARAEDVKPIIAKRAENVLKPTHLAVEDISTKAAVRAEDTAINAVTEYMKKNNIDPQQIRTMLADSTFVAKLKTWVEAMKAGNVPTDPEFIALVRRFKLDTTDLQTRAKARDILAELMAWKQSTN